MPSEGAGTSPKGGGRPAGPAADRPRSWQHRSRRCFTRSGTERRLPVISAPFDSVTLRVRLSHVRQYWNLNPPTRTPFGPPPNAERGPSAGPWAQIPPYRVDPDRNAAATTEATPSRMRPREAPPFVTSSPDPKFPALVAASAVLGRGYQPTASSGTVFVGGYQ